MSCRSFLSRSARKRPYRSPNNSIRLKDKDLNNVATPPISLSLKASKHTDLAGRKNDLISLCVLRLFNVKDIGGVATVRIWSLSRMSLLGERWVIERSSYRSLPHAPAHSWRSADRHLEEELESLSLIVSTNRQSTEVKHNKPFYSEILIL